MKKIMLLWIATLLFSCSAAEMERKDDAKTKSEDVNTAYAEENVAGGYTENEPLEMNAGVSKLEKNKDVRDNEDDALAQERLETPIERIDARIIKTANMKFQVDDVDMTTNKIQAILKTKGAYISDMNQSKNRNHFYSEITIRVPNLYFDDVLTELSLTGEKVDYKRVTSQDVTEEYVDIQTRLKTKKEVKKRYEEILRSKAKTVSEVLETEEKLRRIQEEIESQEGRLSYLKNQVNFSTIYLTIYEEGVDLDEVERQKNFSDRASNGFESGWNRILDVVVSMTYAWPGILITLIILIWNWRRIMSIKRKIQESLRAESKEN